MGTQFPTPPLFPASNNGVVTNAFQLFTTLLTPEAWPYNDRRSRRSQPTTWEDWGQRARSESIRSLNGAVPTWAWRGKRPYGVHRAAGSPPRRSSYRTGVCTEELLLFFFARQPYGGIQGSRQTTTKNFTPEQAWVRMTLYVVFF